MSYSCTYNSSFVSSKNYTSQNSRLPNPNLFQLIQTNLWFIIFPVDINKKSGGRFFENIRIKKVICPLITIMFYNIRIHYQ